MEPFDGRVAAIHDEVHKEVFLLRQRAVERGDAPPTDYDALDGCEA